MIKNTLHLTEINAPIRQFRGRVEIYDGSTLTLVCGCNDYLKSFKVERVGEPGKFFGYGICQKLIVNLLDKDRELNVSQENTLEVEFAVDTDYLYPFPNFYVDEVKRDEATNELTITAYDALYNASKFTVADTGLVGASYSLDQFTQAAAALLGVPLNISSIRDGAFSLFYNNGANFEGTETLREALDAIAEATQSIYYINQQWELVFKRLDKNGDAVLDITKEKYFSLDSKSQKTLSTIAHITELGDNVSATVGEDGITQYIRNNPFWDLRDDIGDLISAAADVAGGFSAHQFSCSWRGNYLLEIGDKVSITTKDDNEIYSYILSDTIAFNGALSQVSEWEFTDSDETASNPATLGEVLKQTYARVDKANKEIALVVNEVEATKSSISALQLNTEGISASVAQVESNINDKINNLDENFETIREQLSVALTPEDIQIQITEALDDGIKSVETSTGFTFNEEGLTINKSDSEMSTQITEDGMTVSKNNEEVLVANNIGVKATNLHATTYLIVGTGSRFEDYTNTDGEKRTGCFWIGG